MTRLALIVFSVPTPISQLSVVGTDSTVDCCNQSMSKWQARVVHLSFGKCHVSHSYVHIVIVRDYATPPHPPL